LLLPTGSRFDRVVAIERLSEMRQRLPQTAPAAEPLASQIAPHGATWHGSTLGLVASSSPRVEALLDRDEAPIDADRVVVAPRTDDHWSRLAG